MNSENQEVGVCIGTMIKALLVGASFVTVQRIPGNKLIKLVYTLNMNFKFVVHIFTMKVTVSKEIFC
jgi:hypothetical protein